MLNNDITLKNALFDGKLLALDTTIFPMQWQLSIFFYCITIAQSIFIIRWQKENKNTTCVMWMCVCVCKLWNNKYQMRSCRDRMK